MLAHIASKHIVKIERMLSSLASDLAELDIILRCNKQRRELEKATPKLSALYYFDGTIKLILPRKVLVAHLEGLNEDEAINSGFEKLVREIKTYRGKHFKTDSQYNRHETLRKDGLFKTYAL